MGDQNYLKLLEKNNDIFSVLVQNQLIGDSSFKRIAVLMLKQNVHSDL